MAANKKIIVIDPERGSMVEATVDNELYNILTASRKQVGNVHITTEQKVANVFRTEVRNYMHTVEVGGKAGTFYGAFKIDYATTPVLSDTVNALANRALEFDEISVDEVLVPRVRVTAIQKNTTISEIKSIFLSERYSRLPVYDDSIDDIIGFITEKDFFGLLEQHSTDIQPIIKNILRLPEFARISEAMKQMQRSKSHIAIVLDQYGGTKGIVTLEDIIEELVGEIYDEADEVIPLIFKRSDGTYEISGECTISALCDALHLPDDSIVTECSSVGGWLTELAGHIAEPGETVSGDWFRMTVLQTEEQRILRVLLELKTPESKLIFAEQGDTEHEAS